MKQNHYDVIVAGAGPAGLTCARILSENGKSVLLLERRSAPDETGIRSAKACGGLLSSRSKDELTRQRLVLPSSVLCSPQIFAVETLDLDTGLSGLYRRDYTNIDRNRFDSWLTNLLPPSAEVLYSTRFCGFEYDRNRIVIYLHSMQDENRITCDYLVGADGASSLVRAGITGSRDLGCLFAVQHLCRGLGDYPYFQSFFSKSLKNFYGWMIPKGDYSLIGCAAPTSRKPAKILNDILSTLASRDHFAGEIVNTASAYLESPSHKYPVTTGEGRILLAGEAARFISPSSGEGIGFALSSGRAAAESILSDPDHPQKHYKKLTNQLGVNIAVRQLKKKVYYNATVRNLLLLSGISSIKPYEGMKPASEKELEKAVAL
jgi:flavin-dependent dehydrogenase